MVKKLDLEKLGQTTWNIIDAFIQNIKWGFTTCNKKKKKML